MQIKSYTPLPGKAVLGSVRGPGKTWDGFWFPARLGNRQKKQVETKAPPARII